MLCDVKRPLTSVELCVCVCVSVFIAYLVLRTAPWDLVIPLDKHSSIEG